MFLNVFLKYICYYSIN